ncbi:DUF3601 domain-containing protein [Roseospira navarrensis]|uniref:DUF3601 domain-containing protein n=1 Tax=Roseospira navarrensis TaxID=140058 RepID=A0A7X1ZC92_9PROT|nr:DUF3601 domain-containing protein [Roseospira navarrensis]MQX35658.1 DUF3601 domain-containing protein [Roseospira navarrensis]
MGPRHPPDPVFEIDSPEHTRQHYHDTLRRGRLYRVTRAFTDYDGEVHPVGEIWAFRGYNFLPYDDGLSLFAVVDGALRHIRLQDRPESEGAVVRALGTILEDIGAG